MNYTVEDNARSYIEKVLAILDIEAQIYEESIDDSTLCFRIDCKPSDAKLLIGRKGQTLEALQFIIRQMCKSGRIQDSHFMLDVANYRSRRREMILDRSKEGAVAVLNGEAEEVALEPMTPFERRMVHRYLQEHFPELSSSSHGDGEDRHIVISYVGLTEADSDSDAVSEDGDEEQEEQEEQ